MANSDHLEKLVQIIRPFVKNPGALENVSAETNILTDLGVNSARLIDIVLALEDEFGIEIDDDAADRVHTLGDALAVIHDKTAAG